MASIPISPGSTASSQNVKSVMHFTPDQFQNLLKEAESLKIVSERMSTAITEGTIRILTMAHKYLYEHESDQNNNAAHFGQSFLLSGLKDTYDVWDQEFQNQNKQFNNLMEMVSSGQKMYATFLADLEQKQESLMEIQSDQEVRLYNFGEQMTTLFQLLAKNKENFTKRPKGPLGSCISARGKTWLKLLETLLQPYLYMFIADNPQDAELLNALIDKVYGKYVAVFPFEENRPQVWVTNFDKCKDVKNMDRIFGHLTVLDAIIIHDHDEVIEQTLWQMLPVGHILLFRTQHEAFPEVSEESVPKKCVMAYTLDFFKVYPYPSFRTSKIEPADTEILSFSAGPVAIRKCEQEIKEVEASANNIQASLKTAKESMIQKSESIHGIKKILIACKSLIQMMEEDPTTEVDLNSNLLSQPTK